MNLAVGGIKRTTARSAAALLHLEFGFDGNADCIMIKKHDVSSGVTTYTR